MLFLPANDIEINYRKQTPGKTLYHTAKLEDIYKIYNELTIQQN